MHTLGFLCGAALVVFIVMAISKRKRSSQAQRRVYAALVLDKRSPPRATIRQING